jgi:hypothetical protein
LGRQPTEGENLEHGAADLVCKTARSMARMVRDSVVLADRTIELESPQPASEGVEAEAWYRPFARALRPEPIVVAVLALFVLGIYVLQSVPGGGMPNHGDTWSEMVLANSLEQMSKYGIWQSRLALPWDDGMQLGVAPFLYANWPTAHFVFYALMERAGMGLAQLRIFPLLETATAGYLLFCTGRRVANRLTGIFALLFFVTAAPIRIMADSLIFEPADLLGRIATIFAVVVTTGLDPVRQRSAWKAGIGLTALCIAANGAVMGFESTPAACIFAFGYPLLYSKLRNRTWRPAVIQAVLATSAGLVVAAVVRLTLVAFLPGRLGDDLEAMRVEAATRFSAQTFPRSFLSEWSHRIWVYWPVLLIVAVAAIVVAAVEVITRRRRPDILLFGALLLISEFAWIVVVRQHSLAHVHTLCLLTYSFALPAGWLIARIWAAPVRTRVARTAVSLCVGLGFAFILTDPGVKPYGIMVKSVDVTETKAEAEAIASRLPADSVIGYAWTAMDSPHVRFFLDRPFVVVPNNGLRQIAEREPTVVVTSAADADPYAQAALDAGAEIIFQDNRYIVFQFDNPAAIPYQLDPDG